MSVKLSVNPLVVAAALGLLGPAALVDDDEPTSEQFAGTWKRAGDAPGEATQLGRLIEVIEVDDQVLLDDGTSLTRTHEHWTRVEDDALAATQSLVLDGESIERTFRVEGDALIVTTRVLSSTDEQAPAAIPGTDDDAGRTPQEQASYAERFTRVV